MIVLSLALVGAVSACGNKQAKTLTAPTEGLYIDLGDLKYQVQISRPLNAADVEDREVPQGRDRPAAAPTTSGSRSSFASRTSLTRPRGRRRPTRSPTRGQPVRTGRIDTKSNDFAYNPVPIPGRACCRNPSRGAELDQRPAVLFKIPRASLDNRPLELKIHNPDNPQQVGTSSLDVSGSALALSPAISTPRAAGAAVSPPAPWRTTGR